MEIMGINRPRFCKIFIWIVKSSKEIKDNFGNSDGEDDGTWHVITATNVNSAYEKMHKYLGGVKANNLVVSIHGASREDGTIDPDGDNTVFKYSIDGHIINNYNNGKNTYGPDTKQIITSIKNTLDLVKPGGNIAFTGM